MTGQRARYSLYSFLILPKDWDGFGSNPLSSELLELANKVFDIVRESGNVWYDVIYTIDETVIFKFGSYEYFYELEIEEENAMGMMVKIGTSTQFLDVTLNTLKDFL